MSLAIFAAPFDNHTESYTNNTADTTIIHKKRMQQQQAPSSSSSHNKTQKKRENFDTQKVNSLLEKIHNQTDSEDENDEYSSLFQPPPNPESMGASKTKSIPSIFPNQGPQPANRNEQLDLNDLQNYGNQARAEEYYKKNIPNYEAQKQTIKSPPYPNYSNYSNYYKPSTSEPSPDVLMQKINYMISLLEEQKDEKTNNVTEEFIMYSFLGIFIIYIVDAFARSGKYTR